MKLEDLRRARRILIYGYGREGASSEAFLKRHAPKARLTVHDDGGHDSHDVPAKRAGAKRTGPSFAGFDAIVVSPGIPDERLRGTTPSLITSNAKIFFDNLPEARRRHVIGVSGTKGKSTTTSFCAALLARGGFRVKAAGNIGAPLLDVYDDFVAGKFDYVVAELSSYQLQRLRTSPGTAIFLNIYREHLNRHHTFRRYLGAKANLWKFQGRGDVLITPAEWRATTVAAAPGRAARGAKTIASAPAPTSLFPRESTLASPHFRKNLGTALALARLLKIDRKTFQETAAFFKELPYRLEYFATKRGVRFYDDSLSTNPDSATAAVKFFGKKLSAIVLGGQDRGQEFEGLAAAVKAAGAWAVILESETAPRIEAAFKKLRYEKCRPVPTMEAAARTAFEVSKPGSRVVLSPAAPSYDRFKNYEEKGSRFKKAVRALR